MGKYENMTKHERVQRAADTLVELITEAATGYPKPMMIEAVLRRMQIGMAKAELMIETGPFGWYSNRRKRVLMQYNAKITKGKKKRKQKYKDPDDDPKTYVRNFDRNSRW